MKGMKGTKGITKQNKIQNKTKQNTKQNKIKIKY
jgi:hypothetical protein